MRAIIKNLGPIKNNRQAIDLTKNFYVFVGENSSGKTYVSQLLWTIFNQDAIRKFASKADLVIDLEGQTTFEISKQLIDNVLEQYALFLKSELATTYNIESTPAHKTILDKFSIVFEYDFEKVRLEPFTMLGKIGDLLTLRKAAGTLRITVEETNLDIWLSNVNASTEDKQALAHWHEYLKKNNLLSKKATISKNLITAILELLLDYNHKTFFLPASRTFYATFYQYIYEFERERREKEAEEIRIFIEKMAKTPNKKILKPFKRPYAKPLNELFEKIYNFNKENNVTDYYKPFVQRMEQLMGGSITTHRAEGIGMADFLFQINDSNKTLPLYMASSSVNQLTLLYLYWKYWAAEEANFLMIDEPEENLHPKNQIKLLEILIDFANCNHNKVLVTTHSPLFAEAVNNYLYLDVLKNKFHTDLQQFVEENELKHINPEVTLPKEKLGVYFFNGNQIIEYSDDNYGIFFRDFKAVSDAVEKNGRVLTDFIYLKNQESHG
jgi:AAA15 family ATPase/GTPase